MKARPAAGRRSSLDGWPARLVAVLIAVATAALLYRIEQSRVPAKAGLPLPGAATAATPAEAAFLACLAKDKAAIDKMRAEGLADEAQAQLFLSRAEARCRATSAQ